MACQAKQPVCSEFVFFISQRLEQDVLGYVEHNTIARQNHYSVRWASPSSYRLHWGQQNVQTLLTSEIQSQKKKTQETFSTSQNWLRVWVRKVIKIAAVRFASNQEKECSCFPEGWVNVRSVWWICVVMLRTIRQSTDLHKQNHNTWTSLMETMWFLGSWSLKHCS